jgi:hypothetical protein
MRSTFINIEYMQPSGVTKEACTLSINFSNAMNIFVGTSILISQKIENQEFRRFLMLRDKWKSETLLVSSGSMIISNSAYKEIINLGNIAIPWIIRELNKTNDHWFYALEKISGENPILDENIGRVEEMKKDWINWASNKNYI